MTAPGNRAAALEALAKRVTALEYYICHGTALPSKPVMVGELLRVLETARHDFNQIISETDMNIKMAIAHDAAIDITEALEKYKEQRK